MKPGPRAAARDLRVRILERVRVDQNGCWIWQLTIARNGYSKINVREGGRKRTAVGHRLAYEVFVGPISEGLELDHLCRVRACVNPDHLEPVTPEVNRSRACVP